MGGGALGMGGEAMSSWVRGGVAEGSADGGWAGKCTAVEGVRGGEGSRERATVKCEVYWVGPAGVLW